MGLRCQALKRKNQGVRPFISRLVYCLGASTILAGCDLAPDYHPQQFVVPSSWHGEGPFQIATPREGILRSDWWTLYNDPILNALEARLEKLNPDLQAAAEIFTQSRALAVEAESSLFPQVGIAAGGSNNKRSANNLFRARDDQVTMSSQFYSGVATWEPDFWSLIRNRTREQEIFAQQAAAEYALAKLSLRAELANNYILLRGMDAQNAVYDESIVYYEKAVHLTKIRQQGAISSGIDVARAQNQLSMTKAAQEELRAKRAVILHAIAILVNVSPSSFQIQPADRLTLELPTIPVGLPADLLQRRPDISSAERAMAAANREIGIARAAFYPNVTFSITGGFMDNGIDLASLANSMWSYGGMAVLPLFEGGLRRAELQRSWAKYRETVDNYRSTVLAAFKEVEDSLSNINHLGQSYEDQKQAVAASTKVQAMTMTLYQGALTNYLDVIVAQIARITAQISAIQVKTQQIQASVQLIRALGGGWKEARLPKRKDIRSLGVLQYEGIDNPKPVGNVPYNKSPLDTNLTGSSLQRE
ncbi:Outer membrane protein OprM [Entomobacter blattae]|uniref:Outer membrane protein OprM n=2 Tax=Entomobacter blattae TaxID=2762277 RepID=A0A7H1NT74_9PROT|nr:Outer membrane protein OprM [Entomobacter blattae]